MKRTLILMALLSPAPMALALEPQPGPSSSPAAGPLPATSPSPEAIRLQTLLADKNVRLMLKGLAPGCRILRVALLRQDPLMPGFGAFNRPVRVDQALGRVVTLMLGPEFQPHRYGKGDIRLSCFDAGGRISARFSNKADIALDQSEIQIDVATAFGPDALDAQTP